MKSILLLTLFAASTSYAGTTITPTANGLTFQWDGAVNQSFFTTAMAAQLTALKAAVPAAPVCPITDTSKLAAKTDLTNLATKDDVANLLAQVKLLIAAIPSTGGGTVTPTPTPVPTPAPVVASGIFIGTTQYQHLADAGAASKSGDTIHITKSLDNESTEIGNGDITIACDAGVKLTWSGGTSVRPAWGKGIIDYEGTGNFKMTGCEISGVILNGGDGGNASAVRLNDSAVSASFDSVFFHDNNDGILGGAQTVTITNSKFLHNGVNSGGYANVHNIYISAYTNTLNVSNSYFGQVTPAHLFKSRAKATNVNLCQFETVSNIDGSYLIDLPNGGAAVVQHSVFIKAPNQSQRGSFGYGEEGLTADGRVNTWEFKNNVVINDGNGRFLDGVTTGVTLNFHDNTYVGPVMDNLIDTANNTKFADRTSAGLAAAPALPAAK